MPNKEISRTQGPVMETKMASSPGQLAPAKTTVTVASKVNTGKGVREAMSPPAPDPERTELLGSLTTQQQQRTSARVIKKLRLEPPAGKGKSETECETPSKIDDKELKFPTVKQRMPKALWSTDEKNLFFEALNEYGKDFDAITAYICAKMKKKGMPDGNLKTKTQVSHFYYRTWHKLSKHVHFDENVKKVAQELYALINYGELRKKLVSVNEKTCARLGEMVLGGSMVVRARGKNLRVRTPMCRALRKLNQITGCVVSRVCWRGAVVLRARCAAAWARVHAAAHNPRLHAIASTRTKLKAFIRALERRWAGLPSAKLDRISESSCAEEGQKEMEDCLERACDEDDRDDVDNHLGLETDRLIVQELRQPRRLRLHVGPRPDAEIHLPLVRASEQLSTHKICLSSYLERVAPRGDKAQQTKIRTPKRQRKDSATEKDKEIDSKKFKLEESEAKLINIDETAIDGIELMASFKSQLDDEEKPSTEDEKELKSEETAEEEIENVPDRDKDITEKDIIMLERDKDMSEREKDSFSEMEDDEKYNKSDDDDESDHGKEKSGKEGNFKNLKVKFRIRPKKRGGSMYTLVLDKEQEEPKAEEAKVEDQPEQLETAARQVRRGWSQLDAGELTLGDLYLMFGSRSRLELDYWWAEPTPPLPRAPLSLTPPATERDGKTQRTPDKEEDARESDTDIFSPKAFGHDSNDGLSGDERKGEQLASPEHKAPSGCGASLKLATKLVNRPTPPPCDKDNGFAQLSDRLKRLLALAGNPHVGCAAAAAIARCECGHVCPQRRQPPHPAHPAQQKPQPSLAPRTDDNYSVFRHPTPIAPRPDSETQKALSLEGLPPLARGRRRAERRVVVQRLLPLLPKLPPAGTNLIPVKIVPPAPAPRLLPKPPPPPAPAPAHATTNTVERPLFYVISESNGQFYFHDGDKRIPISPPPGMTAQDSEDLDEESDEGAMEDKASDSKEVTLNQSASKDDVAESGEGKADGEKSSNADIANFLPSESMSLSPSRLLRDSETWLGSVQDFSLSSFLNQLETRQELGVDSQLQSLMAESSVDYVAKFADLAAEVTGESGPLPSNEMP